ncbi:hypothetical protein RB195_003375 [Necator americanus]|uniref:Zasp-like motif domain-containing protein n=1 Tax=Necator americanus TaxID=51031 RepID=A0ABR1DNB8_NECAM
MAIRTTLARCRRTIVDTAYRCGSVVAQTFWTIFYFFYFLLKGKPEWKCEAREEEEKPKNCCVDAKSQPESFIKHNVPQSRTQFRSTAPTHYGYQNQNKGFFQRISDAFHGAAETVSCYARRAGRFLYGLGCKAVRVLGTVVKYIWAFLRMFFTTSVPSKTLPATPKPFQANPTETNSFNKVEFKPEELSEAYEREKLDTVQEAEFTTFSSERPEEQFVPLPMERHVPVAMPRRYSTERHYELDPAASIQAQQRFTDTSLDGRDIRENVVVDQSENDQSSWSTRTATNETVSTAATAPAKKEPPGLGKLPADVMAELHGTQKMRQEREASVQREMTQSCHPDMTQWKTNDFDRYDRSATATPFRASSVGPTMRKLEQVVSRLEDSTDNEPQYIFRAKPSDYLMGKSVYSPIEEAEQMRDVINRERLVEGPYRDRPEVPYRERPDGVYIEKNPYVTYPRSNFGSRPVTPAHSISGRYTPYGQESYAGNGYKNEGDGVRRRARTVGPLGRENMPQATHTFYANAPVASHTVRRTPISFDRGANFAYDRDGVTQGVVSNQVRRWPPVSNATGAEVNKNDWVKELTRDDDGLITTMARSKSQGVIERKVEDNWKWHDNQGQLLDEKNQKTWRKKNCFLNKKSMPTVKYIMQRYIINNPIYRKISHIFKL